VTLAISTTLLTAFAAIERRAERPLIPVHTWKIRTLVSGTTVMLGISGVLVGAVFLTSIFVQSALGFSPLMAGLAFLPFALAITAGTQVARHLIAHASPRIIAVIGLLLAGVAAGLLSLATASSSYATNVLPGLLVLGLGVGMVFVPVSVTSMAGIPAQHSGTASGFLMTGHEVGAALGVAVLSAVAATAGSLASPESVASGFSRGFIAAAAIALVMAVIAFLRMSSGRVTAGGGGMHGH
jgi:MFS family permease